MWQADVTTFSLEDFEATVTALSESLRPVLSALRTEQAKILGVETSTPISESSPRRRREVLGAEIFVGHNSRLLALVARRKVGRALLLPFEDEPSGSKKEHGARVELFALGMATASKGEVAPLLDMVQGNLDVEMEPHYYSSARFEEIREEAVTEEWEYGAEHVGAAEQLRDGVARSLATKVKRLFVMKRGAGADEGSIEKA